MRRLARARARTRILFVILPVLLLASSALAGWGDESWGEMIWRDGAVFGVPLLSPEGLATLALLLVTVSLVLVTRRRRRAGE